MLGVERMRSFPAEYRPGERLSVLVAITAEPVGAMPLRYFPDLTGIPIGVRLRASWHVLISADIPIYSVYKVAHLYGFVQSVITFRVHTPQNTGIGLPSCAYSPASAEATACVSAPDGRVSIADR